MGYFVIAQIANLPHWIHNGEGVGGGRVVGWIPIVRLSILLWSSLTLKLISGERRTNA